MTLDHRDTRSAPSSHVPPDVGEFQVELPSGSWWWSEETFRIHGFEPGEVVPTTTMVLAHKHPDDRERVRIILDQATATGMPFRSFHRIIDAHGTERTIVLLGAGERRPDGSVARLTGYFVDVTTAMRAAADWRADEAIRASAANRSTIEQAKGVLSVTLDVDPDAAFHILRGASNATNIALRSLAGWLLHFARAFTRQGVLGTREITEFLRKPYPPPDGWVPGGSA